MKINFFRIPNRDYYFFPIIWKEEMKIRHFFSIFPHLKLKPRRHPLSLKCDIDLLMRRALFRTGAYLKGGGGYRRGTTAPLFLPQNQKGKGVTLLNNNNKLYNN